jgi:hypothetical protein
MKNIVLFLSDYSFNSTIAILLYIYSLFIFLLMSSVYVNCFLSFIKSVFCEEEATCKIPKSN